jgi:threonine dehydratase
VDDIFTVSDAQLVDAMRFFAERMKMVVEPTGCLAFAARACAALEGGTGKGERVGVIVSGGNVEPWRATPRFAGRSICRA